VFIVLQRLIVVELIVVELQQQQFVVVELIIQWHSHGMEGPSQRVFHPLIKNRPMLTPDGIMPRKPRHWQIFLLLALSQVSLASSLTSTVTERLPEPNSSENHADCDARLLLAEACVRVQVDKTIEEELEPRAAECEARGVRVGQQTTTQDRGYVRPPVIYGHLHMAKTGRLDETNP
jgi:hypothetical protein